MNGAAVSSPAGVGDVGTGSAMQMGDVPKTDQGRRHCSWLQASSPQNSPACWRPLFPVTGFGQHDYLDGRRFQKHVARGGAHRLDQSGIGALLSLTITKRRQERPPVNPPKCDGIGRPCSNGRSRHSGIEKAFAGFGRLHKAGARCRQASVAQVGDYNGDGKSDILLLDSAGDVAVWLMNGATVSSSVGISNVGVGWQAQNVNAQ